MRILVLGGTVFLGRQLVAEALARGDEVSVVSRGVHGPPPPERVEWLRGDRVADLPALVRGREWDAAIDTSGYVPAVVGESARLLADRVAHLSFVSTANVYRDWPAQPVSEESPVWQDDGEGYGPEKARSERACEAAMPGRVAHLRSGLLAGPHDATLRLPWWIERIARGGDVLVPGSPRSTVQLIDARDFARFTLDLAARRHAGTLNVTAPPEQTTFAGVLDAAIAETGSDARLHWVPDDALLSAGVEPWSDLPLWGPDADGFRGTWRMATDRAHAAGLTLRPMPETIADTWAWLQAGGADHLDDWGSHARPDAITPERERELLAPAA